MATVASVKRSIRGNNLVDPYTEEEVDARYRLMLKPGEVMSTEIETTNKKSSARITPPPADATFRAASSRRELDK